jgi:hypothetical protein
MFALKNWARAAAGALSLCVASAALAHAPSGAIFTTVADGSEVNFNHYPAKQDVYLDGGPGPGAPQHAAGLDDGRYVFQVTDPSGKTLLSTDAAKNRQFDVVDGVINNVVEGPGISPHLTGFDVDHDAVTVQLYPFNDTPNPGGVYKVWVTRVEDYLAACEELGVANGLDVVDPGTAPGNKHGFIPAHCKTDNFKVREKIIIEIDTRFYNAATKEIIDGGTVTWVDTNGASNDKHSYYAPQLMVFHEAHVEAVEGGVHTIVINDQPGYKVNKIRCPDGTVIRGPGEVKVKIPSNQRKDLTVFIDVDVDLDEVP